MKNMTQWVIFSYPENTPDTKMCRVFVSGLNNSGEHGEHNHCQVVFSMSGSRGWGGNTPDIKNTTM